MVENIKNQKIKFYLLWVDDLKKDWFGYFLALILAIVGVSVSYYFYNKGKIYKEVVFAFDFMPSTIYDIRQKLNVPLEVKKVDGTKLDSSVHVSNNYFLNRGTEAALKQDILESIIIKSPNEKTEFLGATITKQSRPIVKCEIEQLDKATLKIEFNVLEQSDGCGIRIFYTGDRDIKYRVSGTLLGQKTIVAYNDNLWDMIKSNEKNDFFRKVLRYIPTFIYSLMFAVLFLCLYKEYKHDRRKIMYILTFVSICLCLLVLRNYFYFNSSILSAPKIYDEIDSSLWIEVKEK